jgi:UDP-2,4-diacetamido-2,4,6-trideoxy-beta-L-altropyranose hydrolase
MRVAIRADASGSIGWGHVKRCLALAQALRAAGAELRFHCAASDIDVAALVRGGGFAFTTLADALDAEAMVAALADWPPAVLVVDHYRLAAPWHEAVRAATGAAIAVIDDLADRPLAADLVIDHNPVPDGAAKYGPVLTRPARLCTGPAYALLDAVYREHARCVVGDAVRSIAIFMGGSDPDDHSTLAWRACREQAGWSGPIEIASTSSNPHLPALRRLAAADAGLRLCIDQAHLADFHGRNDLQIGAGGGALWERCCLGVPTLALICAENQRQSVPWLAAAGVVEAFEAIGADAALIAPLGRTIAALVAAPQRRLELQRRALAWVDGRGAERAAAAVLALGQGR